MIFHAQRFANPAEAARKGIPAGWRYSPHFHYLGFYRWWLWVLSRLQKISSRVLGL